MRKGDLFRGTDAEGAVLREAGVYEDKGPPIRNPIPL